MTLEEYQKRNMKYIHEYRLRRGIRSKEYLYQKEMLQKDHEKAIKAKTRLSRMLVPSPMTLNDYMGT